MLEASSNTHELPAIPGKRYFTIGEVSELCAVKPHVLRYWEQEFPQLKPVKRRGNRRYYYRSGAHPIAHMFLPWRLTSCTIAQCNNLSSEFSQMSVRSLH